GRRLIAKGANTIGGGGGPMICWQRPHMERLGGTSMESSIPCSHRGRALVVKGAEEVENTEANFKYQDKAKDQRPGNYCPHDTVAEQGNEPDVDTTPKAHVAMCHLSSSWVLSGARKPLKWFVYYYYPFSALSDPGKLYNDLRWNISRPQGFEAVMRVRCSQANWKGKMQLMLLGHCKKVVNPQPDEGSERTFVAARITISDIGPVLVICRTSWLVPVFQRGRKRGRRERGEEQRRRKEKEEAVEEEEEEEEEAMEKEDKENWTGSSETRVVHVPTHAWTDMYHFGWDYNQCVAVA
ncbi:hypothetical protein GW17_00055522, partial [Ensete ventricosum]